MHKILNILLEIASFTINLVKLFLDDIFAIILSNEVGKIINLVNTINPPLKFTIEIESKNCLPFLNILIIRHRLEKMSTDFYKKKNEDQ